MSAFSQNQTFPLNEDLIVEVAGNQSCFGSISVEIAVVGYIVVFGERVQLSLAA